MNSFFNNKIFRVTCILETIYFLQVTHKHGFTMTGSSGIVSWLVEKNCKRIVVLWSSPFFSKNKLAVGITNGIMKHDETWYTKIMKGLQIDNLNHKPRDIRKDMC